MAKKYRRSYEKLYERLCWELDIPALNVSVYSDYDLLKEVNKLLIKWNCTPLTEKELKEKLL